MMMRLVGWIGLLPEGHDSSVSNAHPPDPNKKKATDGRRRVI